MTLEEIRAAAEAEYNCTSYPRIAAIVAELAARVLEERKRAEAAEAALLVAVKELAETTLGAVVEVQANVVKVANKLGVTVVDTAAMPTAGTGS